MSHNGYNLEPVEEADLDLASRFGADAEKDSLRPEKDTGASEQRVEGVVEKSATEKDGVYQKILANVKTEQGMAPDPATLAQDASILHQQTDRESQIQHLLDLAVTKGVVHAVGVAEHAEDYYVLDQVHDRLLADEFHEALQVRGLIKE